MRAPADGAHRRARVPRLNEGREPVEPPGPVRACQAEYDEEQSCTDLGYPDGFGCGTDVEMQPLCLDPFRL